MANVINSLKLGDGTYVFTTPYATCDTPSTTVEKVATITPGSNFSLETGARVAIKFTEANTAAVPTLNVNSTGGKVIYFKNAGLNRYNSWSAGQIVEFIYDGNGWVCSAVMTDTDTKNTAGSTDTSSKIFLIGATSQAANPQTYSHDTVYVGTDGCLYSNYEKVATLGDNNQFTGSNTFTKTAEFGDINAYTGTAISTYSAIEFYNGVFDCGKLVTDSPDDKNLTYKYNDAVVKFPKKSGTIALTSDLDLMLTNTNIFTGYNYFDNPVSCRSGINATNGTNLLDSASLKYNCINRYTNDTNYTLTIPAKTGTIALTSDIPSTSSFATLSGNNTFTGLTAFNNTVSCGTIISNSGFIAQNTSGTTNLASFNYDSITRTTNSTSYTLTIPAKDGTIALTSDIPSTSNFVTLSGAQTISGNKTFTGTNKFYGNVDIKESTSNEGNFVKISGTGSIYAFNDEYNSTHGGTGANLILQLPLTKEGSYTIATTSDIPIKTATLSGTTLSITLS